MHFEYFSKLLKKAFPFPLGQLLLLASIYYLTFISRIVYAPLLPILEREFNLGHAKAGSLFLYVALGNCIGLFGSSFISSRLDHRRTVWLSITTVGLALVGVSYLKSLVGFNVGLGIIGVTTGLYFPSSVAIITELISKEHWGKVMAIHEAAPSLGLVTAPLLVEALLKFFPWQGILAALGMLSIIIGFIFSIWGRGGKCKGERPSLKAINKLMISPSFWLMAGLFTVSIGAGMGMYMMMPLFLVFEIGIDRILANTVVGFSRIPAIILLFLSGFITDRVGHKNSIALFLTSTALLTILLGLTRNPIVISLLLFFQAASVVYFYPAGLSLISLIFPSYSRSLAISMIIILGLFFGVGMIPSGIGYLAKIWSFSSAFVILGILVGCMIPLLFLLKSHISAREG